MNSLLSLPIAYLLGSIPSAVWIAKIIKGIDIREHGSKNAGLTNVFRVLGFKPALPVVITDLLKGFLAPTIAVYLNKINGSVEEYSWLPLLAGILAILGHSFTCFAGFKGGKGVLTAFGVFLALVPYTALLCFLLWVILVYYSKYVSVGSIGACVALIIFSLTNYFLDFPDANASFGVFLTGLFVAFFVIIKHKVNIVRLMNGTENGFGPKRIK
ncbi:MAG: glycerol-3-phosphate 1-O-acyltransferase PlsY [Fibrobacter sp.]|nr:glycerol-3-phosphate 1-O-acyltransferase PlsY [Fibrobacter sp.]